MCRKCVTFSLTLYRLQGVSQESGIGCIFLDPTLTVEQAIMHLIVLKWRSF